MSPTHPRPTLVLFLGGMGGTPVEDWMRRVLEASALDSAEVAVRSGAFRGVVLATDAEPALSLPGGIELRVDDPTAVFRFGPAFVGLAAELPAGGVAYLGAGSGPLLREEDFQALAAPLHGGVPGADPRETCVTNNRFSSDCFALLEPQRVAALDPVPPSDNAIPRRLRDEQGMRIVELPRTLETQFNLDTPVDAVALALSGRAGPRLAGMIDDVVECDRMVEASRCFVERTAEVFVAGRVSSRTWQYLEREAACRIRLLSEERGMQSAGTDASGNARSLLGQLIAEVGPRRFFGEMLPQLGDAAFIDLRPALVQLGLHPSRADRFAADLGRVEEVRDPGLREIVEAAVAAPVPVVLGGHSLVGGCLELLNQWAWDEHDGLVQYV